MLMCLTITGHGQRAHTSKQYLEGSAETEDQKLPQGEVMHDLQMLPGCRHSGKQVTLNGRVKSMKRLARFLLEFNNAAAGIRARGQAFRSTRRNVHPGGFSALPRTRCLSMSSDFSAPATAFFSNMRTPAAVIAATAIKEAWQLWGESKASKDVRNSAWWTTLRYAYMMLMLLSVVCEFSTMFVATRAAGLLDTRQLCGQASTLSEFLLRDLEFEFVTVRLHFGIGIFSFLLAIALRVRYTLRRYTSLSVAALLTYFYAVVAMMAYANAHPIMYGGYAGLVARYFYLHWQFFLNHISWHSPTKLLSQVVLVACVMFYCHAGLQAFRSVRGEAMEDKLRWR